MDENIDIRPLPKVRFVDDEANASKVLGKTAYYDPQNCAITLYITDRHPKDILRSFAHEMIHHMQNMQGRLGNISTQNINQDDNLKGLEKEAYQLGNIMLRSWENSQDKVDEIKVEPKNVLVNIPLTKDEETLLAQFVSAFYNTTREITSSQRKPNNNPDNPPLTYTLVTIEEIKNGEYGDPEKILSKFSSIYEKLKHKPYIFNAFADPKIKQYPNLRDTVVSSRNYQGNPELMITLSDFTFDPFMKRFNFNILPYGDRFGAFNKNTGKYIKYSDLNEIKVQPGKTGVVAPLTSEEKEWIKKQLRDFDPGDTPPNDPDKPLTYTFMNEGWIEDYIEDEDMTSKDLEIFKSITKKLGKSKVYTFNNGHDSKVDSTPHLHDSVIRANYDNNNSELTVTWSDWGHDNPYPYGAFGKNTGKYIKYSDLNEIKLQPFNTGVGSKLRVTFTLDPSYFFYPKDIKSIDDVNERHFGGWINSKGLPKMQGDLYRNDSSNVILSIIKTNTNTPHEHLKAWEDKLDSLKIPYKDKLLTQDNKFGITDIDANKYLVLNIGQPTNEIKVKPGKTGVNIPLTQEEKDWISNELYVLDRYYPPNQTDPDTPVEYVFATKKWIENDIEDEYKDYKDLEIFNSIYQKLKNKIYIFNFGHDPKIKNYPESYDLRDAVVRADFENNNPELTVTLSDRADGSYGSEYGAFDKDTGEYLKYSDLDKIGKIV
jgi:hypothetical protein